MNKRSWLIVADLAGLLFCLWLMVAYPDAIGPVHDIMVAIVGAFVAGLSAAHAFVFKQGE